MPVLQTWPDALSRLRTGTARNPPLAVEGAALEFVRTPSHSRAADVLLEIAQQPSASSHRPVVLQACIKALRLCECSSHLSFHQAVTKIREQYRMMGRRLPGRAVGSTLLLKGLEADAVVILDADGMNSRNLYGRDDPWLDSANGMFEKGNTSAAWVKSGQGV